MTMPHSRSSPSAGVGYQDETDINLHIPYVFGSSRPRDLSYLDFLPAKLRVYNTRLRSMRVKDEPTLSDYLRKLRSPDRRRRDRSVDSASRYYVFGSSTPRDLSYLANIPWEYRIYDVKLGSRSRRGDKRSKTTSFSSSGSGNGRHGGRRTSSLNRLDSPSPNGKVEHARRLVRSAHENPPPTVNKATRQSPDKKTSRPPSNASQGSSQKVPVKKPIDKRPTNGSNHEPRSVTAPIEINCPSTPTSSALPSNELTTFEASSPTSDEFFVVPQIALKSGTNAGLADLEAENDRDPEEQQIRQAHHHVITAENVGEVGGMENIPKGGMGHVEDEPIGHEGHFLPETGGHHREEPFEHEKHGDHVHFEDSPVIHSQFEENPVVHSQFEYRSTHGGQFEENLMSRGHGEENPVNSGYFEKNHKDRSQFDENREDPHHSEQKSPDHAQEQSDHINFSTDHHESHVNFGNGHHGEEKEYKNGSADQTHGAYSYSRQDTASPPPIIVVEEPNPRNGDHDESDHSSPNHRDHADVEDENRNPIEPREERHHHKNQSQSDEDSENRNLSHRELGHEGHNGHHKPDQEKSIHDSFADGHHDQGHKKLTESLLYDATGLDEVGYENATHVRNSESPSSSVASQ